MVPTTTKVVNLRKVLVSTNQITVIPMSKLKINTFSKD